MLFRGAWSIEKGGSPCSFGRYGAQRHHFEAAHSIRLAPTDFHTEFALSKVHSIRLAPTDFHTEFALSKAHSIRVAPTGIDSSSPCRPFSQA